MKSVPILRCLLMACLFLAATVSTAQTTSVRTLERVLIVTTGQARISGTNARVSNDKIRFITERGAPDSIEIASVKSLYVRTGSQAATMAILGAVTAGVILVAAASSSEPEPETPRTPPITTIAFTCFGGAIIGGLIGSTSETWELVPLPAVPAPTPPQTQRP